MRSAILNLGYKLKYNLAQKIINRSWQNPANKIIDTDVLAFSGECNTPMSCIPNPTIVLPLKLDNR